MSVGRILLDTVSPSPSPSPSPGIPSPTAAADIALSSYYLAVVLLVISTLVVAIALFFALRYHSKVLQVVGWDVRRNGAHVTADSSGASVQAQEPSIAGPATAAPGGDLVYALKDVSPAPSTVDWTAVGGTLSSHSGDSFLTSFDTAGSFQITATYDDSGTSKTINKTVAIGATATASSSIALPFVIKNWGRLVVVIFGIGVVSALMAAKILDSTAGVGILGTLLGVGAVSTTTGGNSGGANTTGTGGGEGP